MEKIIIAIDGHSACGKSTLAKALAKELGYIYIDSGAMYRAVTLFALESDCFDDEGILNHQKLIDVLDEINISFNYNSKTGSSDTFLNGMMVEDEIRKMAVSRKVSKVSVIEEVRTKLVNLQQGFGKNKGIVMDGRDIGTVVFPNAELKLWVTANIEVRTARRYKELLEKGQNFTLEEVKQNVLERDRIDSTREISPLKRSEDAKDIDNSFLSKSETLNQAIKLANEIMLSL